MQALEFMENYNTEKQRAGRYAVQRVKYFAHQFIASSGKEEFIPTGTKDFTEQSKDDRNGQVTDWLLNNENKFD
jgi:hypothetical protein